MGGWIFFSLLSLIFKAKYMANPTWGREEAFKKLSTKAKLLLCCFLLLPELFNCIKGNQLVLGSLFKSVSCFSAWMLKAKFLLARLLSCVCFLVVSEDVLDIAAILPEAWVSVTSVCFCLLSLSSCCPFRWGVLLVTRAS